MKNKKETFEDLFYEALKNAGSYQGAFESEYYINDIQSSIDECVKALKEEVGRLNNVDVEQVKGFLAEVWHAETFNINAVVKKLKNIKAIRLNDNSKADIILNDDEFIQNAQVKYYKDPSKTAKAISNSDYHGMNKIVPEDQVDGVKIKAHREHLRNIETRPNQSAEYKDTAENASDRLKHGGVEGKPISEPKVKQMAKDFKDDGEIDPNKYGLNAENFIEWKDIAKESAEAALHAAILSAAITAATILINEKKNDIETLLKIGGTVAGNAASAAVRASVSASILASCRTGLMGEALKNISPQAIGMCTTLAINSIKYAFQMVNGKITKEEYALNCIRDSFILTGGYVGANLGQAIIPVPILGSLIGSLVGGTLGGLAHSSLNQILLGYCVESGWSFFGLVQQDYTIPDYILKQAGYEIFEVETFEVETFEVETFEVETFEVNTIGFTPLRRGLLGINKVGYIT